MSSSTSDTEELQRLKKRARGVLPGSFFSIRQEINWPIAARHQSAIQDRRGIAKTKVSSTRDPSRLAYKVSSSEDDEAPLRDKRNFVDLTRNEKIQDNADGWDIEEDLIDRMLNHGRRSRNRTHQRPKGNEKLRTAKKRKRQRRMNEFIAPATNPGNKDLTKLSIVDACDVYEARTNRSPPAFMKVAGRQMHRKENFGRRAPPNGARFSFADPKDQEDVQNVITEWQNGSIANGIEQRTWKLERTYNRHAQRPPAGHGAAGSRIPLAPLRQWNASAVEQRKRTAVKKGVSPSAPIIATNEGFRSRQPVQPRSTHLTSQVEGASSARLVGPRPNPFSKPPVSQRPNEIAKWLRTARGTEEYDESGFLESPQTVIRRVNKRARTRKLSQPQRRDVYKLDTRFRQTERTESRQLSLDDVWVSDDSISLTFGVIPIPAGAYLDTSTLMGKRLVAVALTAKPIETELQLWNDIDRHERIELDVACNKLATSIDAILDEIDGFRLTGEGKSAQKIHHEIVAFAEFLIQYLNGLSEAYDVRTFGSKQMRLTEIVVARLDATLVNPVNLQDDLYLLALAMLQTLLVACYQVCVLASGDLSILGADQLFSRLCKLILQCLLNGGFEPVQRIVRKLRGSGEGNASDSILLDIWGTLYHVSSAAVKPSFWDLLQSELDIAEDMDGKIRDRAWYTIMNISAITVLNLDGVAGPPSDGKKAEQSSTIWTIVESLITPYLQLYSSMQHPRFDFYIRTLFGRSYTLLSTWGWTQGAKPLLTIFYAFFTDYRFDNLKTEPFSGFPKLFRSDQSGDVQTSDTTFVIFLKLIISYITQQVKSQSNLRRRERLLAAKELDRFVIRITPLRTYQTAFSPQDYIALQNHYCLLLALYWASPATSRPSVARIRDVVDIERAPAPAQVICIQTWNLLARIQIQRTEDIASTIDWFNSLFQHAMNDYYLAIRRTGPEHVKSKTRILESIVLKALQALADVIALAGVSLGALVEGPGDLIHHSY